MTGDGVNDAPALSAAQCGIAVHDATDAAKGAAAMILTTDGLSAVFGAIIESRKIFNRLSSYITYRLASTIQILLYLSILVYAFEFRMKPMYVILLALFNDVTMIPVAEDRQTASAKPQHAKVGNLISFSVLLGVSQSIISMIFFLAMADWHFRVENESPGLYSRHSQNAMWLQVSIAAELLIFVSRAPGPFFLSRPSANLLVSTMIGNIISTVLAVYVFPDGLCLDEVGKIWAYDLVALFVVDTAKLSYKYTFEGYRFDFKGTGILDEAKIALEDASSELKLVSVAPDPSDIENGSSGIPPSAKEESIVCEV
jgi:H+-transporting ATPase